VVKRLISVTKDFKFGSENPHVKAEKDQCCYNPNCVDKCDQEE